MPYYSYADNHGKSGASASERYRGTTHKLEQIKNSINNTSFDSSGRMAAANTEQQAAPQSTASSGGKGSSNSFTLGAPKGPMDMDPLHGSGVSLKKKKA